MTGLIPGMRRRSSHAVPVAAEGIHEDLRRVWLRLAGAKIGCAAAPQVAVHVRTRDVNRGRMDRTEVTTEVRSIMAVNQVAETFRHCPKCGADHFTQRMVRGGNEF